MSTLDHAEANHNGVVVEEVPAHERTDNKFKDPVTNPKHLCIGDYNLAKCCGNNRLATCFSETSARHVGVGTLSHSHLLLVILCHMTGAQWDVLD
jgi:hypothetical protein